MSFALAFGYIPAATASATSGERCPAITSCCQRPHRRRGRPGSSPSATCLVDAVDHTASADYGAVSGTVTDGAGEPVAASVEVVGGFETATADEAGGYELILEPGEVTLRVPAPRRADRGPHSYGRGRRNRAVPLDVSLPATEQGTIAGLVTDASRGTPIVGATVSVAGAGATSVTTGADGRYVVEVVGDRNNQITTFLEDRSIPAVQAGWEVTEALEGVSVVILHNPPDPGRDEFLAALDAFDEAGVSVIFPADGWSTRTRGVDLLSRYTGAVCGCSSATPIASWSERRVMGTGRSS